MMKIVDTVLDIKKKKESMCYGEGCEVRKPGDSQTCSPENKNIYL